MNHRILVIAYLLTCSLNIGACQEPTDIATAKSSSSAAEPGEATVSQDTEEQLRVEIIKVESELQSASKTLSDNHPQMIELKERLLLLNKKLVEDKSATQSQSRPKTLPPLRIVTAEYILGEPTIREVGIVVGNDGIVERVLASFTYPVQHDRGFPSSTPTLTKVNDTIAVSRGSLRLGGIEYGPHFNAAWQMLETKSSSPPKSEPVQFGIAMPTLKQTLFAPTIGPEGTIVWQQCTVEEIGASDDVTVVHTSIHIDAQISIRTGQPDPKMLFDEHGNLVALRVATTYRPSLEDQSDPRIGSIVSVAFASIADLAEQLKQNQITIPDGMLSEFSRRKRIRFDNRRPVELKSMFLNWSDDHDELYGFSRKSGKTSTLKIEPKDFFDWLASDEGVIVDLGDSVAGYSSVTESWDVIRIDALRAASKSIDSVQNKLSIKGLPHHYEFSTQAGKWISPTDGDIGAKRPAAANADGTVGFMRSQFNSSLGPIPGNTDPIFTPEPGPSAQQPVAEELAYRMSFVTIKTNWKDLPELAQYEMEIQKALYATATDEEYENPMQFAEEFMLGKPVSGVEFKEELFPDVWNWMQHRDLIVQVLNEETGKLQEGLCQMSIPGTALPVSVIDEIEASIRGDQIFTWELDATITGKRQHVSRRLRIASLPKHSFDGRPSYGETIADNSWNELSWKLDGRVVLVPFFMQTRDRAQREERREQGLRDFVVLWPKRNRQIATCMYSRRGTKLEKGRFWRYSSRATVVEYRTADIQEAWGDQNNLAETVLRSVPRAELLDRPSKSAGAPDPTKLPDRSELLAQRQAAELQLTLIEEKSREAAAAYRAEAAQESPDEKAVEDLKQKLADAVKAAFDAQMELQQVRLELAEQDLSALKNKQLRRNGLSQQIIERRVADLMSGEDLEWPQAATQGSTNNSTANANRADPELDGEWRMLDITGMGIISHQEGLKLRTSAGKWTLVSGDGAHETKFERRLDSEFAPTKIDLFRLDAPGAPPIYSGIYKVEGDKLTVAWAPSDGSDPRPTEFSGKTGTLQTFARVKSVPTFATPQELVDYVTKLNAEASEDEVATMDQMFDLVTDDEINRFAGLMLRTTSMMQMAAGLGAAFGNSDGSGGDDERQQVAAFLQAVGRMNLIVNKYRHESPAPEALAAYQEIAGGLNLSMLFQAAQPTASVSADEYSQKLRLAAGVLNDPKAFLSEIMKQMQTLEATQSAAEGKASGSKVKPDWQVTVNGDSAFAIDRSAKSEASNTLNLTGTTQRMDLIKVGDTWKISSLIPDNVIIEMQQGPTVTESSLPVSAQLSMQPSYQPAFSAPTPPMVPMEVRAAVAANYLTPFTELNSSNVSNTQVFADSDKQKAIDASSVHGRYINRPLSQGEQITADMLIDKPTTQQVVDYWLEQAAKGENVFVKPEPPAPVERTGISDDAARRPYRTESVEYLRPPIPDWTQDYLNELNRQLAGMSPGEWTLSTVNQVQSLAPLVQLNTSKSTQRFGELGKHLHGFLVAAADTQTAKFEAEVIAAAQSSELLGLAFRLNGSIPEEILDATPASPQVRKKLELLTTMIENKADDRWIAQERRRLFGLLEEAPVQALKILMTLGEFESAGVLENWLFSMSSERAYNQRHYEGTPRGTPFSPIPPIVDPLLVIGVADLINHKGVRNSETLAWFFYEHAEDQEARFFISSNWAPNNLLYNHISDIIEGNLTYREFVLASLVSIYSKTDSQLLKDNIANLAPAVPVTAPKP